MTGKLSEVNWACLPRNFAVSTVPEATWGRNQKLNEGPMSQPLMPKATAVWLIDNTALTFDQIAKFCTLHPLEVKGIADGDVAAGVRGFDPIANGQLLREELDKAQEDPTYHMKAIEAKIVATPKKKRKGPRYTPISRRQDRPDAIMWIVRNHPEVPDSQIAKLLGTTKATITAVRDRTHWNSANIKPVDPVTLGLASQIELDEVVRKAAAKKAAMEADKPKVEDDAGLMSPEESLAASEEPVEPEAESEELDAEKVFGSFTSTPSEEENSDPEQP